MVQVKNCLPTHFTISVLEKNKPFVAVNCSALSENLLASELFGHVQGAFTDAKKNRQGLFLKAEGGTIFLDEIGDMPMNLQVKLLRALEERKVRPVGSDVSIEFDARVITATNVDMQQAMEEKRFREDLYYRINVIELKIPPLRERQTDIILLTKSFIKLFCAKYSKSELELSKKAYNSILSYSWPGNIRELKNAVEHAVIICQDNLIQASDLPSRIFETKPLEYNDSMPLHLVERNHILSVYKNSGYNKEETANRLQISKRTLYRRLSEFEDNGINIEGV